MLDPLESFCLMFCMEKAVRMFTEGSWSSSMRCKEQGLRRLTATRTALNRALNSFLVLCEAPHHGVISSRVPHPESSP